KFRGKQVKYKNYFNTIYNFLIGGLITSLIMQAIVNKGFSMWLLYWLIVFVILTFFACFIQLILSLLAVNKENHKLIQNNIGIKEDRKRLLEDKKDLMDRNDRLGLEISMLKFMVSTKSIGGNNENRKDN
ncbi:hypothetical protein, partial [Lactobacillus selangorensis]